MPAFQDLGSRVKKWLDICYIQLELLLFADGAIPSVQEKVRSGENQLVLSLKESESEAD